MKLPAEDQNISMNSDIMLTCCSGPATRCVLCRSINIIRTLDRAALIQIESEVLASGDSMLLVLMDGLCK